ncbi:MAG TPA: CBS domain-containing protein [Thermomicrobiales bacterium]|nr:CBS domain-containing protein [Thermomicrobiales bacterium]
MESTTSAMIGDLIVTLSDTISPDESISSARRRMESQTSRSLIVVESDRPVGIVRWRGLAQLDGTEPVRSVMATAVPVLRSDMTVMEARDYLAGTDVDYDHLPVIDDSGMLIGEIPRRAITKSETATDSATGDAVSGAEADRSDVQRVHLEEGMKVVGEGGSKLGTVSEVNLTSDGDIGHFGVKHGLLGRNSKRLPSDVIQSVADDTVQVRISPMEFKMLADIGEQP